ncbi:MAG: M12 family metallo-peptidase [Chitinophagales bacterium]
MRYFNMLVLLITLSISTSIQAENTIQETSFYGIKHYASYHNKLVDDFEAFNVYLIDSKTMSLFLQKETQAVFTLNLGLDYSFDLELYPNDMRAYNYEAKTLGRSGIVPMAKNNKTSTYRGFNLASEDSEARLSIDEGLIYGYVGTQSQKYYIEPLRYYVAEAQADEYIVYKAKDAKTEVFSCAAHQETASEHNHLQHKNNSDATSNGDSQQDDDSCSEVEVAIVADYAMYLKFGTVDAVNNHILAVMNLVEGDYSVLNLQYVVVEQIVVTCDGCDPWTTSTDPTDLLNDFISWASGGFSITHDIGQLWTDRDFNGTAVGLSYIGTTCFDGFKYGVYQDYATSVDLLKTMTSHEIGHNLGANHDAGTGFIMSPSVQLGITDFSTNSINEINSNMLLFSCLTACTVQPTTVSLNLKLLLEGTYSGDDGNGNLMETFLVDNNLLPTQQAYDMAPWNYNGGETLSNIPATTVDWILIELRDANNNDLVIDQKAGLLMSDGFVKDIDDNLGISFDNILPGSAYYIVVRHCSHLDIMSSVPVVLSDTFNFYDFTTASNQASGIDQLTDLGGGLYGLHTGDVNGNGVVNVFDVNECVANAGQIFTYGPTDLNMDGHTTIWDYNILQDNASLMGIEAVRY